MKRLISAFILTMGVLILASSASYSSTPNNSISGNAVVCSNASAVSLLGSLPTGGNGSFSYQWLSSTTGFDVGFGVANGTNTNQNYFQQSLSISTWYKRVVISGNEYDTSAAFKVTLAPKPVSSFLVDNATQCLQGKGFTFNNTSTTVLPYYVSKYKWDFGNGDTATQTFIYDKKYNNTGAYTVKLIATDNNGCIDTFSKVLSVFSKPNVTISFSGPSTYCQGDSVTLSVPAGSGNQYQWNGVSGSNTFKYTFNHSQNFKVVVTNTNGCKDSSTTTVTVNKKPKLLLTVDGNLAPSSKIICRDDSVRIETFVDYISADVTNVIQWRKNNALAGNNSSYMTLYDAGKYDAVVTNSLGCTTTTSQFELKEQVPNTNIQIIGKTKFCKGETTILKAATDWNYAYMWYRNGEYFAGPADSQIYVQKAGAYKLKLTSLYNCVDSSSDINIDVYQIPQSEISSNGLTHLCVGSSIEIAAGIGNGFSYRWYKNNLVLSDTTNKIIAFTAGDYKVVVTDSLNDDCVSDVLKIISNPNPVISFEPNDTIDCMTSNGFNFINTSYAISPDFIPEYSWNFGDGDSSKQSFVYGKKYGVAGKYKVTLKATSSLGCTDSTSKNVYVVSPPASSIIASGPTSFCQGKELTLSAKDTTSGIKYQWISNGNIFANNVNSVIVTSSGSYELISSDTNKCIGFSSPVVVTVNAKPLALTILGETQAIIQNSQTYVVPATFGSTYSWLFKNGVGASTINSINILWNKQGIDTVKVIETSQVGCVGEVSSKLVEVHIQSGINEKVNANRVEMYPNPSNGLIEIINGSGKIINLEIYNHLGEKLQTQTVDKAITTMDLTHLSSGVYYIKNIDADGIDSVSKIVILK